MIPEDISAAIERNGGCYVVCAVSQVTALKVNCTDCGSEKRGRRAEGETMIGFLPVFLTSEDAQTFATAQGKGAGVMWMSTKP